MAHMSTFFGKRTEADGPYPNTVLSTFTPHWWVFWRRRGQVLSTKEPVRYASYAGIASLTPSERETQPVDE